MSMFDCPEPTQTSPTRTSSSVEGLGAGDGQRVGPAGLERVELHEPLALRVGSGRFLLVAKLDGHLLARGGRAPNRRGMSRCSTMWLLITAGSFTSATAAVPAHDATRIVARTLNINFRRISGTPRKWGRAPQLDFHYTCPTLHGAAHAPRGLLKVVPCRSCFMFCFCSQDHGDGRPMTGVYARSPPQAVLGPAFTPGSFAAARSGCQPASAGSWWRRQEPRERG